MLETSLALFECPLLQEGFKVKDGDEDGGHMRAGTVVVPNETYAIRFQRSRY